MKINLIPIVLFLCSHTLMGTQTSPNILILIVDDLRTDLGCYGNEQVITPNIDHLASDGYLFKKAYVQQAVCSASRASFLTGVRPITTGVDYPYSPYFKQEFWPQNPTIAEYFEKEGYEVFTLGKVHHSSRQDDIKNTHYSPDHLGFYALPENIAKAGDQNRNKFTPHFERAEVPETAYQDGLIANKTISIIDQNASGDKPFLIITGFKKPHLPFNAPENYWRPYDAIDLALSSVSSPPLYSPDYTTVHHELNQYAGPNTLDNNVIPTEYQIELKKGYYACISYIDALIGQVIDKLKETDQYDNTLIVLMSDHGFHLGDQGMWGKATNYEVATHSPLIFKLPGKAPGSVINQLVEYVDIYPTLVEMIGNEPRIELEGTSFRSLFDEPNKEWKSAVFSQFNRGSDFEGYSIRTEDFRYVEWRHLSDHSLLGRELFDMRTQSIESINVVNNPAYANERNDLAIRLKNGWKEALPTGVSNYSNNNPAPNNLPWGSWELPNETCDTSVPILIPTSSTNKVKINPLYNGFDKFTIYDLMGKLQLSYVIEGKSDFDVSSLKPGVYLIKTESCYSRLVVN